MAQGYMNEMASTKLHVYQQMSRNRLDKPFFVPRQKSGSWRGHGFYELADSQHPRYTRGFNMVIHSDVVTDGEQDFFNEFHIRSTPVSHDPTAQVESPKCDLCMKEISQKSCFNLSRTLGSKELPVVGILECGHVYHAECLDQATPGTQVHDPPCPRCENQTRAQSNVWNGCVNKSRMRERFFSKGKMSRVGISIENKDDETNFQPNLYQRGSSESPARKNCLQTPHKADKTFLAKSLLRKQVSFRGKMNKEGSCSGFGSVRPGYAARVLPDNGMKDYKFCVGGKLSYA